MVIPNPTTMQNAGEVLLHGNTEPIGTSAWRKKEENLKALTLAWWSFIAELSAAHEESKK